MKLKVTAGMALALMAATCLAGTNAAAQTAPKTPAQLNRDSIAPVFGNYTDQVLFGDIWVRPGLSPRDRSMVVISALATMGRLPQFETHLGRALDNGVTPTEVSGLLTQLGLYAGWPAAVSALDIAVKVFAARGIDTAKIRADYAKAVQLPPLSDADARAKAAADTIAPVAPKLAEVVSKVVTNDLWRRPELTPRDRSLVTIASLAADGSLGELPDQLRLGVRNGLTRVQIGEAFTQLAFYAGLPKALAAVDVARPVMAALPAAPTMTVFRAGVPTPKADDHFMGLLTNFGAMALPGSQGLRSSIVMFEPKTRSRWHSHEQGQLLIVTEGTGWVQAEGGTVHEVKTGDVIWTPPGVSHWHGATATTRMAHDAVSTSPGVTWKEHVTDAEFHGPRPGERPLAGDPLQVYHDGQGKSEAATNMTGPARLTPVEIKGAPLHSSVVSLQRGSRTAWHSHPHGQLMVVTKGKGWVQAEGGPVQLVTAGDVIWTPAGLMHWHGATKKSPLVYTTSSDTVGNLPTAWGKPVTDAEYNGPE